MHGAAKYKGNGGGVREGTCDSSLEAVESVGPEWFTMCKDAQVLL
jgi:hypothetical protein